VFLEGGSDLMDERERTRGDGESAISKGFSVIEERLGPGLEQVRGALSSWNQKAVQVMKQYPGACLLGALGLGFVIGRLASRR
jgi:hypothetical protein